MTSNEIVRLAERVATEAHLGQFRRGGSVPYIEHPRAVANRVGDDPDAMVVAWLHDVIEDTGETAESLLEKGIPRHCVEAVTLLTKGTGTDYDTYLERVACSPLATKVKIADMLSNLSDQPTPSQIRKYAKALLRLSPPEQE